MDLKNFAKSPRANFLQPPVNVLSGLCYLESWKGPVLTFGTLNVSLTGVINTYNRTSIIEVPKTINVVPSRLNNHCLQCPLIYEVGPTTSSTLLITELVLPLYFSHCARFIIQSRKP